MDGLSLTGNLASLLGFFISIIAAIQASLAKKAALTAAKAAQQAEENSRRIMSQVNTIEVLSEAADELRDIKRLQQDGSWRKLRERYIYVQKLLVKVRDCSEHFEPGDQERFQIVITTFYGLEQEAIRALSKPAEKPNLIYLNDRVNDLISQVSHFIGKAHKMTGGYINV